MKAALITTLTLIALLTGLPARASILYTTTDLGASSTLETSANGQVYGVANSTGSVVYAFDKSPVTTIDERINGGAHFYSYTQYTMQIGQFKTGYNYDYGGSLNAEVWYPTGAFFATGGWDTASGKLPVLDLNSQGQIVGTSINYYHGGFYAAFSAPNLQPHAYNSDSAIVDNLNNYIATIPGVTLTSAFKIDDLGRILADGSNGDVYLLTPTGLGSPSTVPEPSCSLVFGLVGSWLGFRTIRRRSR